MIALDVHGVSKNYPLKGSQWTRLKHILQPGAVIYKDGLWALRDVSFHVEKGEAFGIVGANGSGKSTLLQIIAGILRPTSGEFAVQGRLSALLELGSGFSPEFTGRQNVFMNASILGLSRGEIAAGFPAIERFAGIGEFIDRPIRTYSTGMVLRLAFAVAAHVDPEILIVDEALAVGDIAFRQRCMKRIHDLKAAGTTILFVSHDTGDVKALCQRCLWLEDGTVRALGEADEVVGAYLSYMVGRERARDAVPVIAEPAAAQESALPAPSSRHRYGNGKTKITGADFNRARGAVLRLSFAALAHVSLPMAGFLVRNTRGETIFGSNSAYENCPLSSMMPGDSCTLGFHWTMPELATGRYFVSLAVSEGTVDDFEVCDYLEDSLSFDVSKGEICNGEVRNGNMRGYLRLPCRSVAVHRH